MWEGAAYRVPITNKFDKLDSANIFVEQNISNEAIVHVPTPTHGSNPIFVLVSNALVMLIDFSCKLIIVR